MPEVRRVPRVEVKVEVLSRTPGAQEPVRAFSRDISLLGIGLVAEQHLAQGAALELELEGRPFGSRVPLRIRGEVRWCISVAGALHKCGVRFVDLDPRHREVLQSFVAAHA